MEAFSSCSKWRGSLVVVFELLIAVASLVELELQELLHMGLAVLEWVESSQTRVWTHVPYIGRQILNPWTTREVCQCLDFITFKIVCSYVSTSEFSFLKYKYEVSPHSVDQRCIH